MGRLAEPPILSHVSLRLMLAANFASLGFVMLAALIAMPIYLRKLGAEAYGLIGFYTVLTAGFQMLDVGLSQTLARECARFRAGALDARALKRLLHVFEAIFGIVASIGAIGLVATSHSLASNWLRVEKLPTESVASAIALMGIAVPCQWASGLYRGALNGLERQVLLAGLSISVNSARYFGVLLALALLGSRPGVFFGYQAALALIELALLAGTVRILFPAIRREGTADPIEVGRLVRFSAAISLATIAWMVQTQGDKAILSKVLPLPRFGMFTLAVTATAAVAGLSGPIGQALLPRLTRLIAQNDAAAIAGLYRRTTQLACLVVMPPAMLLFFFAERVLWAWTGNTSVAHEAAPILKAYALGSALLPISAFPYYLQYAYGQLRLHVLAQVIMLPTLLAGLTFAAVNYGAVGCGVVWTAVMLGALVVYAPVVHRKFAPRLHLRWLFIDVVPIMGGTALAAALMASLLHLPTSRPLATGELVCAGALIMVAGIVSSSAARAWILRAWRNDRILGF